MNKLIVFDLSGVVFTNGKLIAAKKLSDIFKVSKSRVLGLLEDEIATNYYLGIISPNEYWDHMQEEFGIARTSLKEKWLSAYKPIVSSFEFIKQLKQSGYKTACLSESPRDRVEYQQEKYRLLDLFDYTVFSYETKTAKPSKELFELLIQKSQINPNESMYLDDKENNLDVAKQMGYAVKLIKDPAVDLPCLGLI